MSPRQRFEMIVGADHDGNGGETFLQCDPAVDLPSQAQDLTGIDINNGPRCLRFNMEHVNAQVYRVSFTYEIIRAVGCDNEGRNTNNTGVLSVSFSMTDELNEYRMTARTYEGQIRSATARINPHSFRFFALPFLQQGMFVKRQICNASPDGLLLNFVLQHVEGYASPPPACAWSAPFKKTFTMGTGSKTYVEISLGLQGSRETDRRKLLTSAVAILDRHLYINEGQEVDGSKIETILEQFIINETIDNENANIFVSARVSRSVQGFNLNTILDSTIGHDPAELVRNEENYIGFRKGQLSAELLAWDTRLYRGNWKQNFAGARNNRGKLPEADGVIDLTTALSTHLQDECSRGRSVADGVKAVRGVTRANLKSSDPPIERYTSEITEQPPRAKRVSKEHKAAPYTTYIMETKLENNQHVVVMPIARWSDGSLSTQTLPSVAHIALAPPEARMIVRVDAVRVGERPEMPKPYSFVDNGIVYQLLESKALPRFPGQRVGGNLEYVESVQLTYSLSRPLLPGETFPLGKNPWTLLGLQRRSEGKSDFFGGSPLA